MVQWHEVGCPGGHDEGANGRCGIQAAPFPNPQGSLDLVGGASLLKSGRLADFRVEVDFNPVPTCW